MVKKKKIVLKADLAWHEKISRFRQIVYYAVSFPLMMLNGYRL